jgi:peptidoglycan/LPS O-acetylase OafA/YrhL
MILDVSMARLFLPSNQMAARHGVVPSLDGLRAVSILIVLSAHFIDSRVFPGGLGVYIFFVISGFLITRLLIVEYNATGAVSLPLFYLRRIIRLYPVIIAFAACTIGLDIALGRPYNLLEPASGLGYFANYLYAYLDIHHIPQQMPFGPFWSLSVEEHFYILLPLVFVLLRGDPTRLMWVFAGLCAACLGLRLTMAGLHPEYLNTLTFYAESQYRLDSIGFGVILALACQMERGRRALALMAHPVAATGALAVVLACLVVRDPWFRETLRYTLLGCAVVVLISAVLFDNRFQFVQQVLNTTILVWIGRLSYSLYIWHGGVSSFLAVADQPHWQTVVADIVATTAVAVISYFAVEQPFLLLRRHLRAPQPALGLQSANRELHGEVGT